MALPLQRITIYSSWSATDENILGPAINRLIDELNALGVRVAAVEPPRSVTGAVIAITAEQEAAIMGVVVGGTFTLRGPLRDIVCQVNA